MNVTTHAYLAVYRGRPVKVVATDVGTAKRAAARYFHLRNTSRMMLALIGVALISTRGQS
jgi:hypothetical protein